ncbi:hypothetical protein ACFVYF_00550 [Streptomyces sp. NPDC058274]|uniref:hypothetical protein n=1 Tax=Streptomyces sp. NPDC058274 TaxID=3346416 RepID=UPI0036EEB571
MITVQFAVHPGQGAPSGFDLGDIFVTGDLDTADSSGHAPDQGMMIYLSVTQLLDGLVHFSAAMPNRSPSLVSTPPSTSSFDAPRTESSPARHLKNSHQRF